MPSPTTITPLLRQPAAASAGSAGALIAEQGDARSGDAGAGKFASVLDAKVNPPASEATPPEGTSAATDSGPTDPAATGTQPALPDLSALLPVIAAQIAAIAGSGGAPGRAADAAVGSGMAQPVADLAAGLPTTQIAASAIPAVETGGSGNFAIPGGADEPDLGPAKPLAAGQAAAVAAEGDSLAQMTADAKDGETPPAAAGAPELSAAEPAMPPHAGRHAADAAEPATVKVETPVSSPRWSSDLAEKVMWIARGNENRAELVLTPASLGRIEVTVTQSPNGDTSVMFVAASSQARDALEQSLPRLREILGDAGISLGQTGVNAESSPHNGSGETAPRQARGVIDALADGAPGPSPARPRYGLGMVDTFA